MTVDVNSATSASVPDGCSEDVVKASRAAAGDSCFDCGNDVSDVGRDDVILAERRDKGHVGVSVGIGKEGEDDESKSLVDGEIGDGGNEREEKEIDTNGVDVEEESKVGMDSGYAWLIVLGAFICWVLSAGFIKSGGMFFLQFQSYYKTGALQAAWPGSVMSFLQNVSGPLVSTVCNRYSVRAAVMFGSVLIFVGLILNSFAYNFYFLFFCHSLLQGVGIGFVLTPGLFIVSSYFDKRRGFAISLSSAGGGLGSFVIVPLVTFLFSIYGFHGCFLILAGVLSNTFVVALLYRPFTAHQDYLLALERNKKHTLCSTLDAAENGDHTLIPLKESTTSFVQRTVLSPTLLTKRKSSTNRLKSSFKIFFPTEHKKAAKRKLFHWALLKDVSFVLYLLNTFLFTMALKAIFYFIPAACVDKGMTENDAALVLSIAGAVDTIGRIGVGFALDTAKLKPYRLAFFTAFLFCISFFVVFLPFLEDFPAFLVVCTFQGTFFGAHVSQRAVVLVDLMGKEMLPSCMGLVRVVQAFSMLAGPLLFGALRDSTGSYKIPFFVGSGLLFMSALALVASNVVFKMQQKKKQQQEEQEQKE